MFLVAGGLLADFTPLNLVGAVQLSDVSIIAAGALALPLPLSLSLGHTLALRHAHPRLRWVAAAAGLYLVGTGTAIVIAGFPEEGVRTWLLFALLLLVLPPATAVAISPAETRSVLLSRALTVAALVGASAYVLRWATGQVPSGGRGTGFLGSDPLFLMLVGIVIALVNALSVTRAALRFAWIGIGGFLLFGLLLSSYRSAWIAMLAVLPGLVLAGTASFRRGLLICVAAVAAGYFAYRTGTLPQFVVARIDTLHGGGADLDARREVIGYLLDAWKSRPWGIGLGESPSHIPAYYVIGSTGAAHNAIVSALVEGGPLAAAGLLLLPFAVTYAASPAIHVPRLRLTALWSLGAMWISFIAVQASPSLYPRATWISVGVALWLSIVVRPTDVTPEALSEPR